MAVVQVECGPCDMTDAISTTSDGRLGYNAVSSPRSTATSGIYCKSSSDFGNTASLWSWGAVGGSRQEEARRVINEQSSLVKRLGEV